MESIYAADSICPEGVSTSSWDAGQARKCGERGTEDQANRIDSRGMTGAHTEAKRDTHAEIDFNFYDKRARTLRSAEFIKVAKIILRFFRAR